MNADLHKAADAAVGRGQVSEAIALLERGLPETPDDYSGWMKLAALRRRAGNVPAALAAANIALDARPNDFMALLVKGSLHEHLGETVTAAEIYHAVLSYSEASGPVPPPLAAQLQRIRAFLANVRTAVETRMESSDTLDPLHRARSKRFLENVLDRRLAFHQEPTHYRYPDLPDIEYFDLAHAEWRARIERAFPDILAEYHALARDHADRRQPYVDFAPGQPLGQWSALNRSPDWNAFHLIRYGEPDPINAAKCSKTIAAFSGDMQASIPGLGPNLMFSLLAPHTHIPPHHGVANFRTVCHFPLIVPAGCRFRVGAETREWQPGTPWIFDDTIEHEAWNDSDDLRVVLIGDLWRPELDAQDRAIVCDFMAAQDGGGKIGAL